MLVTRQGNSSRIVLIELEELLLQELKMEALRWKLELNQVMRF